MSARAYAQRDDRTGQIVAALDAKADAADAASQRQLGPIFGPE